MKGEQGRLLRILLVEDSENDALLLLRELRRGGYEPVWERVDAPEEMRRALREADERGEPWEIVISDYYMPRFEAPEAIALLRSLGYDTPVIVVSGKVGEEAAVEAMRAGAQDYITKGNMTRLNAAVARELAEAEIRRQGRRAEEALGRSEERFRRLVEQAADAVLVHDLEGNFVDVNRRACESLGYSREELLGMNVADVETSFGAGELRAFRERIVRGEVLTIEGRHRRKDGSTFPVEVRVGPFQAGEEPLLLALARDITERKEAEKRLREAELRFRTLVEQIPAVTYIQETTGTKPLSYVSPQYEAMLGYSPETEVLDDRQLMRTVHPEDRERLLLEDRRTDETGEPFRAEYRRIARDGRIVWVRDEAVLIRDEEGNPLYWQGVFFDITEQKETEQALKDSEERFRFLAEEVIEGIVLIEDGRIIDANPSYAQMYGYGLGELIGMDVLNLSPPYLRRQVARRIAEDNTEPYEAEGLRKDGTVFPIEVRPRLIPYHGRRLRVTSGLDLTERRRAEEEIRISEARFRTIVDQSPLSIQILSPDGRTLRVNQAWERLWGTTAEALGDYNLLQDRQLVEKGLMPYILRGFAGEVVEIPAIAYDPEESIPGLSRHRETRWVRAFIYPIKDKAGGIREVILVHEDITERKRAEEELKESEELYRTVVEQAAENIFIVDAQTKRILEANDALARSLGYSPEELKEMTLYELVAHDRESVDVNVARLMRERRISIGERRYRRRDGSLAEVEVNASLISHGGSPALCVVAHDVTERNRAERAMREVKEAERARIAREL
ncbi:MAG: PAS domain S-box protein, partial [Actinomycetota bacterium]